jgi:hypothetical protein
MGLVLGKNMGADKQQETGNKLEDFHLGSLVVYWKCKPNIGNFIYC